MIDTIEPPRLSDGQKEQIKLTSTYLNGIAIGVILIGGISLPISMTLAAVDPLVRALAVVLSLFSFLGSPYLHHMARKNLRRLDQ